MTGQLLVFNILSTVYFVLGSIHEEGRLVTQFGEVYTNYKQRVPRLIPIRVKFIRRID
jgi:protein-S-isoprenylcysteine O-methyltransferase Ste14